MEIIEFLRQSKTKNIEECEDEFVFNNDFAAVIDGATSKGDILYNNKTSGIIASKLLKKVISQLPYKAELSEAISIMNKEIESFYSINKSVMHYKETTEERLTASVCIFSNYYRQIWMIGDCQCLLNSNAITNNKVVDSILANVRSLMIEIEMAKGKTYEELYKKDIGREYIDPLLKDQTKLQNNNNSIYGYGVIDGFDIPPQFIKSIDVPQDIREIVLATDGYPLLLNTLKKTEEYLQKVYYSDPLCVSVFKSTKGFRINTNSFDDRTYLKFKI